MHCTVLNVYTMLKQFRHTNNHTAAISAQVQCHSHIDTLTQEGNVGWEVCPELLRELCGSRTHDPWLDKAQESDALTTVLCAPTKKLWYKSLSVPYMYLRVHSGSTMEIRLLFYNNCFLVFLFCDTSTCASIYIYFFFFKLFSNNFIRLWYFVMYSIFWCYK